MSKLIWDSTGERLYETGVKQAALYVQSTGGTYPKGVAWNGITAVTESPSGAEATALYADDIKYLSLISAEEFGATIEAYTYPDEFACGTTVILLGFLLFNFIPTTKRLASCILTIFFSLSTMTVDFLSSPAICLSIAFNNIL